MCGIVGIVGPLAEFGVDSAPSAGSAWVAAALPLLAHRGPDGSGVWRAEQVVLGHTRLAIVDLSAAGAQPMVSASQQGVITYNGEIYGFSALRAAIPAQWRGHSDTEVIVEHLERSGLKGLADLHGMFALALWNRQTQSLILARDRAGIKPLYVAQMGQSLAFCSELAPLYQLSGVDRDLDWQALSHYLSLGFVPAPWTLSKGIRQVLPGEAWTWQDGRITKTRFVQHIGRPVSVPTRSVAKQDQELERLLLDAVGNQLQADVPVGVLLSGGVDSSLVAAAAARKVGKINTFSVVHRDPRYDERKPARAVAEHLGSNHTEIELPTDGLSELELDDLVRHHGDPFADSSSLPTRRLANEVRKHVTVALSGDGGDELFAGYTRYQQNQWVAQLAFAPAAALSSILQGYAHLPAGAAQRVRRLARAASLAQRPRAERAVGTVVFMWPDEQNLKLLHGVVSNGLAELVADRGLHAPLLDLADSCHRMEQHLILPDDMLTKVDRMTMAASIEIRPPLLDDALVQFAAGLPISRKIHRGEGKSILKRLARQWVPPWVVDRPKMGFAIPLQDFGGKVLLDATRHALESSESPLRRLFKSEALSEFSAEFARRGEGVTPEDSRFRRSQRQWQLVVLARSLQLHNITGY